MAGRVLAVDLGQARLGLALSDPLGISAEPLSVLPHDEEAIRRIGEVARAHGVTRLVVGLPLNMDGSTGAAAERARQFAAELAARLGLPVALQDERLSTVEAEGSLTQANAGRRQKKDKADAVAAAIILRQWLDRRPQD